MRRALIPALVGLDTPGFAAYRSRMRGAPAALGPGSGLQLGGRARRAGPSGGGGVSRRGRTAPKR
jgi:hypothetical protein